MDLKKLKNKEIDRGSTRWIIYILVALIIIENIPAISLFNRFSNMFNSNQPYRTNVIYKEQSRPPPDTVVRWLEHITQAEVEPIIRYDTVRYYVSPSVPLISFIKSTGTRITVRTQYTDSLAKEYTFPYSKKYQIVPQDEGVNFIRYRDWLDWNLLFLYGNIGLQQSIGLETEFKVNPLDLYLRPYAEVKVNGLKLNYGVRIGMQIW